MTNKKGARGAMGARGALGICQTLTNNHSLFTIHKTVKIAASYPMVNRHPDISLNSDYAGFLPLL